MNCICCMDNSDLFTHFSGLMRKRLAESNDCNSVIICNNKGSHPPEMSLDFDNCIIISDSGAGIIDLKARRSALIMPYEAVKKEPCGIKNISLITLGTNSRATLCCSSISSDRIMVSLQRSIRNFNNEIIEPAEFCLTTLPEQSQYTSMALLAVQMLIDRTAESISPSISTNNIGVMFTK